MNARGESKRGEAFRNFVGSRMNLQLVSIAKLTLSNRV